MDTYKQISFLPWLNQKEIAFNDVIFWPFNPNDIQDITIREHLIKLFSCYIDVTGLQVEPITIASYKDKNFIEKLNTDQLTQVKEARDILCFLCISGQTKYSVSMNNYSIVPPSGEMFQMFHQNFRPGVYDFAYRAGNLTSGGWTLDDIKFTKPLSTGGNFKNFSKDIYEGFVELLKLPYDNLNKTKILRALEWFRLAHVESDEVSALSKLVMMSTAFEILLDFPTHSKSEYFLESIEKYITSSTFKTSERPYKKGAKKASLAGWWAWDFYKLRNAIVHGDAIAPNSLVYKDWITYMISADIVLLKIIRIELEKMGLMKDIDNFSDIYNILGWV